MARDGPQILLCTGSSTIGSERGPQCTPYWTKWPGRCEVKQAIWVISTVNASWREEEQGVAAPRVLWGHRDWWPACQDRRQGSPQSIQELGIQAQAQLPSCNKSSLTLVDKILDKWGPPWTVHHWLTLTVGPVSTGTLWIYSPIWFQI